MDDSERVIQEVSEIPDVDGATMARILELPEPLRSTLKDMVRGRLLTVDEVCERLCVREEAAKQVVDMLVAKGYIQATTSGEDEAVYCVVLAPIRGRSIPADL